MRQALVLIHGIGEQRPMSTLRGFVETVVRAVDVDMAERPVFSKPDRMSEMFELRRLVAEKTRSRPMTDFFEFYWAHHMEGTKLHHLWPWFRALLLRWPTSVPRILLPLWATSWLLLAGAVALLLAGRLNPVGVGFPDGSWGSLVLAGLFVAVQGFAIGYLGDAARYLSPLPSNIAVRQKVRAEGVDLLRRLHRSGQYDRIIVVGHSLGSVIGYDILTHLWSQLNTPHDEVDRPRQRALERLEAAGRRLTAASPPQELRAFRLAQRELWVEQRTLGFSWLITDFVTLGSPLAHAALLLAEDSQDLTVRQQQRELPTCPPVEDQGRYHYVDDYRYQNQPRSIRILHHAAPFACTRWSNVFFPVKLGFLGDFVGGPVRPAFGPGILDIAVTDGRVRFAPVLPHLSYWRGDRKSTNAGRTSALGALCEALSLDGTGWLSKPTSEVGSGSRASP